MVATTNWSTRAGVSQGGAAMSGRLLGDLLQFYVPVYDVCKPTGVALWTTLVPSLITAELDGLGPAENGKCFMFPGAGWELSLRPFRVPKQA